MPRAPAKSPKAKAPPAKRVKKEKKEAEVIEPEEDSEPESGDDSGADSDDDMKPSIDGKKRSRRNDKNNMAFQKGAYLVRMSDLESDNKLNIWRVDNHQLLQKYERVAADDDSKYRRTNRYTGWMCHEGYKFAEVKVKSKQNKEETVCVTYLTEEELTAAKDAVDKKESGDADDSE